MGLLHELKCASGLPDSAEVIVPSRCFRTVTQMRPEASLESLGGWVLSAWPAENLRLEAPGIYSSSDGQRLLPVMCQLCPSLVQTALIHCSV